MAYRYRLKDANKKQVRKVKSLTNSISRQRYTEQISSDTSSLNKSKLSVINKVDRKGKTAQCSSDTSDLKKLELSLTNEFERKRKAMEVSSSTSNSKLKKVKRTLTSQVERKIKTSQNLSESSGLKKSKLPFGIGVPRKIKTVEISKDITGSGVKQPKDGQTSNDTSASELKKLKNLPLTTKLQVKLVKLSDEQISKRSLDSKTVANQTTNGFVMGPCMFCSRAESNENEYGPIFKNKKKNITAHLFCLIFADNIASTYKNPQRGFVGYQLGHIREQLKHAKGEICDYCLKSGATVTCAYPGCRVIYHFPCGTANRIKLRFMSQYFTLCDKHDDAEVASVNNVNEFWSYKDKIPDFKFFFAALTERVNAGKKPKKGNHLRNLSLGGSRGGEEEKSKLELIKYLELERNPIRFESLNVQCDVDEVLHFKAEQTKTIETSYGSTALSGANTESLNGNIVNDQDMLKETTLPRINSISDRSSEIDLSHNHKKTPSTITLPSGNEEGFQRILAAESCPRTISNQNPSAISTPFREPNISYPFSSNMVSKATPLHQKETTPTSSLLAPGAPAQANLRIPAACETPTVFVKIMGKTYASKNGRIQRNSLLPTVMSKPLILSNNLNILQPKT